MQQLLAHEQENGEEEQMTNVVCISAWMSSVVERREREGTNLFSATKSRWANRLHWTAHRTTEEERMLTVCVSLVVLFRSSVRDAWKIISLLLLHAGSERRWSRRRGEGVIHFHA